MLILVQFLTYFTGGKYKFEKYIESYKDMTKETLDEITKNLGQWYKNYIKFNDHRTAYVAIYKDIAMDKNHLVWENCNYVNKNLLKEEK